MVGRATNDANLRARWNVAESVRPSNCGAGLRIDDNPLPYNANGALAPWVNIGATTLAFLPGLDASLRLRR